MLPLCDLVDDTKQKRELVEQMLHDIQESTLLLCDPASASSKEAFLAVLAEAQEKLNRIQDIIHSFDPRHLDEPESRIAKYSYLIKWIHLLLHALCVFPLGASVYYLCRLTTTFLTENPNWETNRWDIVWSALFGALQVLSVRTFIEGIETRASQLYTAEMERLGQTILTLFQMPVLILATRAIFLTGDDGIYRGGHTHLIAQVLERMQLSLRAHRASPTHPRIFHIQEDSESSDSEEASSVDVTPPASPVLQSPLREAAKRSRDASLPTVDPVQVHLNQNVLTFFQQMERYRASLASHGVPDIFTHQVDDHPNGYREL
jgi:hypothetical protein